VLKKANKQRELVELYKKKGLHRKGEQSCFESTITSLLLSSFSAFSSTTALNLLLLQSQKEIDHPPPSGECMIEYMQHLGEPLLSGTPERRAFPLVLAKRGQLGRRCLFITVS